MDNIDVEVSHSHKMFIDKEGGITSAPFGDESDPRANRLVPTAKGWSILVNYGLGALGMNVMLRPSNGYELVEVDD